MLNTMVYDLRMSRKPDEAALRVQGFVLFREKMVGLSCPTRSSLPLFLYPAISKQDIET